MTIAGGSAINDVILNIRYLVHVWKGGTDQKTFARSVGLTTHQVSRLIRGTIERDAEHRERIASWAGLKTQDLTLPHERFLKAIGSVKEASPARMAMPTAIEKSWAHIGDVATALQGPHVFWYWSERQGVAIATPFHVEGLTDKGIRFWFENTPGDSVTEPVRYDGYMYAMMDQIYLFAESSFSQPEVICGILTWNWQRKPMQGKVLHLSNVRWEQVAKRGDNTVIRMTRIMLVPQSQKPHKSGLGRFEKRNIPKTVSRYLVGDEL